MLIQGARRKIADCLAPHADKGVLTVVSKRLYSYKNNTRLAWKVARYKVSASYNYRRELWTLLARSAATQIEQAAVAAWKVCSRAVVFRVGYAKDGNIDVTEKMCAHPGCTK